MKNINTKKGFTIIEVVLVLAIAGLIFLMVFVALPNLQRSQRDTQRRNDYASLAANMETYMTNHGGKLPSVGSSIDASQYINSEGTDPNGNSYNLTVKNATEALTLSNASVVIVLHANCGTDGGTPTSTKSDSDKHFAVYGYLESGSYCQAV